MGLRFSTPLSDATVQDIQLELIRRSSFNAFDGERVAAGLLAHQELWEAVMLDRFALSRPGKLPAMGLIKLRDLSDNIWNADTLYILARDAKAARMLAKIAEDEEWCGMVLVHTKAEDVEDALGSGGETRAVVSIWWD